MEQIKLILSSKTDENFEKIFGNKNYNVFINNQVLIIQGKTKDGNDFIIDNLEK